MKGQIKNAHYNKDAPTLTVLLLRHVFDLCLSLTTTVTPSCTNEGEAYRLVEYFPT